MDLYFYFMTLFGKIYWSVISSHIRKTRVFTKRHALCHFVFFFVDALKAPPPFSSFYLTNVKKMCMSLTSPPIVLFYIQLVNAPTIFSYFFFTFCLFALLGCTKWFVTTVLVNSVIYLFANEIFVFLDMEPYAKVDSLGSTVE